MAACICQPGLPHAKGELNITAMQSKDRCAERTGMVAFHMLEMPTAAGEWKMLSRSNKITFLGSLSVLKAEGILVVSS